MFMYPIRLIAYSPYTFSRFSTTYCTVRIVPGNAFPKTKFNKHTVRCASLPISRKVLLYL